jgi:hypothetical protein
MSYDGQKNKLTARQPVTLEARNGAFLFPTPLSQQQYLRGLKGPNFPTGVRSKTTVKRPKYSRTHA